jgi:chorismate mutase
MSGVADEQLLALREQVFEIDRVLVEALNERLRLVARIKRQKREHGLPFLDPDREAWLLAHLAEANGGPLSDEGLERFVELVLELTKQELAEESLQNIGATSAGSA